MHSVWLPKSCGCERRAGDPGGRAQLAFTTKLARVLKSGDFSVSKPTENDEHPDPPRDDHQCLYEQIARAAVGPAPSFTAFPRVLEARALRGDAYQSKVAVRDHCDDIRPPLLLSHAVDLLSSMRRRTNDPYSIVAVASATLDL